MKHGVERIYVDNLSSGNKVARNLWYLVRATLFRPFPTSGFHWWRIFLLKIFGAKIGVGCKVASTCDIWAPWNLDMGDYVCLAAGVDCYNVNRISLGSYSTVSQRAFLCTASHDIAILARPLVAAPIVISDHAWICAEAFVAMGVVVGSGAVVGARAVVVSDVCDWGVAVGHPAVVKKLRKIVPD